MRIRNTVSFIVFSLCSWPRARWPTAAGPFGESPAQLPRIVEPMTEGFGPRRCLTQAGVLSEASFVVEHDDMPTARGPARRGSYDIMYRVYRATGAIV